jgi:large subunit ribosomal protein L10
MTAIAYNTNDPVSLAKVLTKFAKDVPTVQFKGALLAGQVVAAGEIQSIANLPTRDELLGKLLYLMQHPIRGLAVVLNGTIRNLAVVLDQVAKQKGGGGEEAPAAEANA